MLVRSTSIFTLALTLAVFVTGCDDDDDGTSGDAGSGSGGSTTAGSTTTTGGSTSTSGSTSTGTTGGSSSTGGSSTTDATGGMASCECEAPNAPIDCPLGLGGCEDAGAGAMCCDAGNQRFECIENDIGVVWINAGCTPD